MGHVFAKTKGGSMAESVNIKNVEDTLNDFCISYKSRYCGKNYTGVIMLLLTGRLHYPNITPLFSLITILF